MLWLENNEIDTGGKREQSLKKYQFTTCDENTLLVMYILFITLYLEQKDF